MRLVDVRKKFISYDLILFIVGENLQQEILFVDEFDIERDKEERPGDEMTHDRVIQEEAKSTKDEGSVHRMANEGIRAICDERGVGIWFGEDAKFAAAPHGE